METASLGTWAIRCFFLAAIVLALGVTECRC